MSDICNDKTIIRNVDTEAFIEIVERVERCLREILAFCIKHDIDPRDREFFCIAKERPTQQHFQTICIMLCEKR